MKRINIETIVGIFLIVGFVALAYMSVKLGDVSFLGTDQYKVSARFANVSGLTDGATVQIAGVTVGKVSTIEIDLEEYEAVVNMLIDPGVNIQEDSIMSIRTQGIIGDKYIKLTPGASDELIVDGGEVYETEPALVLEELISKYMFEKE